MRLIDADALLENVWDVDCRCGFVQVVDRGDIEAAPTIDPEDLRPKGRWGVEEFGLSLGYKITCSKCGYGENRGPSWDGRWGLANYCPDCGADMRGEN